MAGQQLCIGDYVCLYCEATEGYVTCWQTSKSFSELYVHVKQCRDKPTDVHNPHTLVFQLIPQNRYKLNKKCRRLAAAAARDPDNQDLRRAFAEIKVCAEAETGDNDEELQRQIGRPVSYADVIQLKHLFTGKYVHMSTDQTSAQDKNNLKVLLDESNAKCAHLKLVSHYRVKTEKQRVHYLEQVVFESIKSPGQFLHASSPFHVDHDNFRSEVNLGVDATGFTLVKYYRPSPQEDNFIRGGSVIQLHHKVLQSYLVAEGLFGDCLTEDVHLRVRKPDQSRPHTLEPSTSAITYWQIINESSVVCGDVLRWDEQIQLRHMTTGLYLCVNDKNKLCLQSDDTDPTTVFTLHPMVKDSDEIQFGGFARIQHVITKRWLYGKPDKVYQRRRHGSVAAADNDEESMALMSCSSAPLRKVGTSNEKLFPEGFFMLQVPQVNVQCFNFVAGCVPFIQNLLHNLQSSDAVDPCTVSQSSSALKELMNFVIVDGIPHKIRQKLLRNLRVLDLLVRLLKNSATIKDELLDVFADTFDVIHTYLLGCSRKNKAYFLQYLHFFHRFHVEECGKMKGALSLKLANMMVELFRGNQAIIDRITPRQLDTFASLLRATRSYHYLDLLSVVCVCCDVAIPDNQTYIAQMLLRDDPTGLYVTEVGDALQLQSSVVYISTDGRRSWTPLHNFIDRQDERYRAEAVQFYQHQLELLHNLCYGGNEYVIDVMTKERHYFTWQQLFLCVQNDQLPDALRAKFCDLMIELYVDVKRQPSVLVTSSLCFIYADIGATSTSDQAASPSVEDAESRGILATLIDWISKFFAVNTRIIASLVGRNILIDQILRLVYCLVNYNYYGSESSLQQLLDPLMNLLDGSRDLPFPIDDEPTSKSQSALKKFHKKKYEKTSETNAVVSAKLRVLDILDLILSCQFRVQFQSVIAEFKAAQSGQNAPQERSRGTDFHILQPLMSTSFRPLDPAETKVQKKMMAQLNELFTRTTFIDASQLIRILLDLTYYKHEKIVTKSLYILNKYFCTRTDVFKTAIQTQLLLTTDSVKVHKDVLSQVAVLRRLRHARLSESQATQLCQVLDTLSGHCQTSRDALHANTINQNIITSHYVPCFVFDLLLPSSHHLQASSASHVTDVMSGCVRLLRALARDNDVIQRSIFDRFEALLAICAIHSDIALLIRDAFVGNRAICLKVQDCHVEKVIELVGKFNDQVPECLDVLYSMVKVAGFNRPLRRNQALVMKHIMRSFTRVAADFSDNRAARIGILSGVQGSRRQHYLSCLVALLAACAEGENRLAHSMCKTILSVEEILVVLNLANIDNNVKKSFLFYLTAVYVTSTFNKTEMGTPDLSHCPELWSFMEKLLSDVVLTCKYLRDNVTQLGQLINTPLPVGKPVDTSDRRAMIHANLHFMLDAVLPFLFTYISRFYSRDADTYQQEPDIVDKLTNALLSFSELVRPHLVKPRHMSSLLTTVVLMLMSSSLPTATLDKYMDDFKLVDWVSLHDTDAHQSFRKYYAEELEVNSQFRQFIVNASLLYGGYNTVGAQLQIKQRWAANKEYTEVTGSEALPLGTYFQDHVRSLVDSNERKVHKQFALLRNVVRQLGFSAASVAEGNEVMRLQHKALTIKCLQLLRAVIYNEIVRLPDDWKDNVRSHQSTLKRIASIQNHLLEINILPNLMPLTSSKQDEEISTQALLLVSCLLFNANTTVQGTMLEYFRSTREEPLFVSLNDSMHLSICALKESRVSSSVECRATLNDMLMVAKRRRLIGVLREFRKALQPVRTYDTWLRDDSAKLATVFSSSTFEELQQAAFRRTTAHVCPMSSSPTSNTDKKPAEKHSPPQSTVDEGSGVGGGSRDWMIFDDESRLQTDKGIELLVIQHQQPREALAGEMSLDDVSRITTVTDLAADSVDDLIDADEDLAVTSSSSPGNIDLVLRILAAMCDGQYTDLQNYVRDQTDNVQSIKLVSETVVALDSLYLNIHHDTMLTVTHIFLTLNEFASGNQATRVELVDRKLIDYVNVILRTHQLQFICADENLIGLQLAMAAVVYSLIEENGPKELAIAKNVKDTLDHTAVCQLIASCYSAHKVKKPKLRHVLNVCGFLKTTIKFIKYKLYWRKQPLRSAYQDVGFAYFIIMRRFCDIDPALEHKYFDSTAKKDKGKKKETEKLDAISATERKAFEYYADRTQSIELVKDDCVQKVHFRVRDKKILRDEIKESLKWDVDRSSPSEKLRDFHLWFKDIRTEIRYQKMVLDNFIMAFITRRWSIWCYSCMLLSLIINIFMLITWRPQMSLADLQDYPEDIAFPDALYEPRPKYIYETFEVSFLLAAGLMHNVFAFLVFVGYFMANHPQLPTGLKIFTKIRNFLRGSKKSKMRKITSEAEENTSKIAVHVFSFKTLYYVGFLVCSVLGTLYHGYFFSFHLLHIINTNILLGAAIKAVTANGQSLVWVGVLGVVILYIYSLIGFAFLRDVFNPNSHVFCASLTQCFVSVIRYGLIGDYDEDRFTRHEQIEGDPFNNFVLLSVYKISFFIIVTTIGLNLIFGIIVDTFSQLRDQKWRAEADMRDFCFICGINNYKFESRPYGFWLHVTKEHNMWSYMYFMLHLSNTDPSDYTALELYVHRLMEAENLEFFPVNRALALADETHDETDYKLDELIAQVDLLVRKQREQEAAKLRKAARRRQQRWQLAHQASTASDTAAAADDDDDDDDDVDDDSM